MVVTVLDCRSRIIYERKRDGQVFCDLPVESVLGKLPVVQIGDTGVTQVPFCYQCAKTLGTLSTRRLTPDQETAVDGGTSTRGP